MIVQPFRIIPPGERRKESIPLRKSILLPQGTNVIQIANLEIVKRIRINRLVVQCIAETAIIFPALILKPIARIALRVVARAEMRIRPTAKPQSRALDLVKRVKAADRTD